MKFLIVLGLAFGALSAQASAIYVECALTVEDHVGTDVKVVQHDQKSKLFKLPLPEKVHFDLRTDDASAQYDWNIGFFPNLRLENHAQGIRTQSTDGGGWKIFFDKSEGSSGSFRRTMLSCLADA